MFRNSPEYSEWDENGFPTKDVKGEGITKNAKKKMESTLAGAKEKWERFNSVAKKEGFSS